MSTQTKSTAPANTTNEDPKPEQNVEPKVEETKPEPKPITSQALTSAKETYIKALRAASQVYLTAVNKELETVEPGHPNYGNLKFAKIRGERVIFNADELSRGKTNR